MNTMRLPKCIIIASYLIIIIYRPYIKKCECHTSHDIYIYTTAFKQLGGGVYSTGLFTVILQLTRRSSVLTMEHPGSCLISLGAISSVSTPAILGKRRRREIERERFIKERVKIRKS